MYEHKIEKMKTDRNKQVSINTKDNGAREGSPDKQDNEHDKKKQAEPQQDKEKKRSKSPSKARCPGCDGEPSDDRHTRRKTPGYCCPECYLSDGGLHNTWCQYYEDDEYWDEDEG